jgi:hypothetical protein
MMLYPRLLYSELLWLPAAVPDQQHILRFKGVTTICGSRYEHSPRICSKLMSRSEEYISGALMSVKYADFPSKGQGSGVVIGGRSGASARS